jgi:predicted SAM-dependent methyltransferase
MSVQAAQPPAITPSRRNPLFILAHYLAGTAEGQRGINLGCGPKTFPGWLNIDADFPWRVDLLWDLTLGLPFLPEGCMDAIYSEHFFEHIPRKSSLKLLKDSCHGLRRGGHVRIAIPDLDDMLENYRLGAHLPHDDKEFEDEFEGLFHTRGEWLNVAMRGWGHTYIYNFEDIALLLQAAGFVDVVRKELNQSDIPFLANRETRPAVQSSLIVEARKA